MRKVLYLGSLSLACLMVLGIVFYGQVAMAATGTLTALETVANVAPGSDTQTNTAATPTANVAQSTIPAITFAGGAADAAASTTITIPAGLVASAADHSITIDGVVIDLGTSVQTATQLATAIAATDFSGGTNYGLGAYTVTSDGANVIFTKNANGADGNGSVTIADAGYGKKAQVSTITPANVGIGDVFTVTLNGTDYTFTATAATVKNVVEGLKPLVDADDAVTCTEDDAAVTCTADAAGTAFTISSTATNYPGVAQVVTFTPASVTFGETMNIVINGSGSSYTVASGATVKTVVEALKPLVDALAAVTCTEDDAAITCTSATTGTAFTYSTVVSSAPSGSTGTSGGGGSVATNLNTSVVTPVSPVGVTIAKVVLTPKLFVSPLSLGSKGPEVKNLQSRLISEGFLKAEATGYFGLLTQGAVKAYQKAHGLSALGNVGPATRAELNKSSDDVRATLVAQIQALISQVKELQAKLKK